MPQLQPEVLAEHLEAFDGLQLVAGDGSPGLVVGAPPTWTAAAPGDSFVLPRRALVLPGWVGRPCPSLSGLGDARVARSAVLQAGVATWHEVAYDRDAFEAKVRRAGLPDAITHRILSRR